jgi:hypothetical protein
MKMDRTQRGWAVGSLLFLAVSTVAYVVYAISAPAGPKGGSVAGLTFGVIGFAFMIFAALLGARKRVPTWRVGRAQAWMRGHLWLGLLALPLIFFHGGFHFGGTLTQVLMWMLILTVGSGVFGAVLQNYLPRVMTVDVPLETIYDEIAHVRVQLLEEADRAVESVCGPMGLRKGAGEDGLRAGGFTALRPIAAAAAPLRGKRTLAFFLCDGDAAVSGASQATQLATGGPGEFGQRVFRTDDTAAGGGARNAQRPAGYLRGGATADLAGEHASLDAWVAAAAHSAFAGIDFAGGHTRRDGLAVLMRDAENEGP